MAPTLEQTPVRVGDAIKASHVVVAVLTAVITLTGALLPIAAWKGSVDAQLSTLQKQVDRMEDKLDRLTEAVKETKR